MSEYDSAWLEVCARALALSALHQAGMAEATLLEKAEFLDRLALPRETTASLLATSERSLKELARQRDKREATGKRK